MPPAGEEQMKLAKLAASCVKVPAKVAGPHDPSRSFQHPARSGRRRTPAATSARKSRTSATRPIAPCRNARRNWRGSSASAGSAASRSISATDFKNRRSPEYLIIHGLPPDAANETHEDWVNRIHPDDRERTVKQFLDALAGRDEDYAATYRIVRPSDGQTRWIDVVAKIERDGDGRALRLVGAHIDVTERMLAQAEAARKRGALPADRRQRAGADLGHQARPHALLRQPGLCRFPRTAVRAKPSRSTGASGCIRTISSASCRNRSPAKPR